MAKRKGGKRSTELLTPVVGGRFDLAGKGGLAFRKQILPVGSINYEGRKLVFDQGYINKLIEHYKDGAYDQVPFVLADPNNRHTESPELFRGVVSDLSREKAGEKPGLYATIKFPNKRLARSVLDNTELGVSCRIREMVEKADGRSYDVALRHVCGTLDPRVTGMSPWEAVELSGYGSARTVVDLTSATYQEDNMAKAKGSKKGSTKPARQQPNEDDDEFDLTAFLQSVDEMDEDELRELVKGSVTDLSDDDLEDEDEDDEDEDDEDEDDDELDDEDDEDDEDDVEPVKGKKAKREKAGAGAKLSARAQRAIDLAQAEAAAARDSANAALDLAADERWTTESERLVAAGIPARIVELSEPFLHGREAYTVDLTDGRRLNATSRMRKILAELEGFIDMSGPRGHSVDMTTPDKQTERQKAVLDEWEKRYPSQSVRPQPANAN